MVQAAQSRHRHYATVSPADGSLSPAWSLFLQPEMSSVVVVIMHVFRKKSFQVTLVERDHMIKKIASAASHPELCHSILPGTPEGRSDTGKLNRLHCR